MVESCWKFGTTRGTDKILNKNQCEEDPAIATQDIARISGLGKASKDSLPKESDADNLTEKKQKRKNKLDPVRRKAIEGKKNFPRLNDHSKPDEIIVISVLYKSQMVWGIVFLIILVLTKADPESKSQNRVEKASLFIVSNPTSRQHRDC